DRIKLAMKGIDGIVSINDDNLSAAPEIQVELKPSAAALGFTPIELAQQVRGAVYGLDAHVFTADREDVDVRVRLDASTRSTPTFTQDLWVVAPSGLPVPLAEVATVREGVGYAQIRRTNRMRTVTVTGDVREGVIPEQVVEALAPALASIVADTPGLVVREGGRQKDLTDAFSTLPRAALTAFLLIYAILCWLFGSFIQPFAVMATIPFGVIGAVWGHAIMGYELTFLSLIGIVALSGVVVNNALVLVEFVNELRTKGMVLHDALIDAGTMRLRAILLTSITTVFGLAPLMLEQSFQARFLIPMAISLCFGLLSATMLTLLLLPAQLLVADSIGGWIRKVSGRSGLQGEGASIPG
ncbi:MAG: efflux RND transporter permease subunit, partial [Phycisphaerae bacterium]|nr:efflux RND transporter permease subunit [Phycisphaerae bacterium]